MAIVIEEQQGQTGNIINIALWIGLLATIAGAVYFLFFVSPDLVNYVPPTGFTVTQGVAGVSLDPQAVFDDPRFKGLKAYITIPEPADFGRTNPFLSVSAGSGAGFPSTRR